MKKRFEEFPRGAFIGDINELGGESENIHKKLGRTIAEYKLTNLYLIGQYSKFTGLGAILGGMHKKKIHINPLLDNTDASIEQIRLHHQSNEVILFKASHTLRLDRIADEIAKLERNNDD